VIGIDIGKNSLHTVGLDQRGAIVMRQNVFSEDQILYRFLDKVESRPC
jgi:hypothetical protein